jgi:Domain of unknown function (DUF4878)
MHHNSVEKMMKRRIHIITALALALIVVFTGACNKNSNTAGGSSSSSLSPTDTLKAYYDAANKKDVAGIKKYLSKGTINMMEVGAKNMGKNLDDALKESASTTPQAATPKFTNEKITGDNATVDISSEGQTVAMPLVKEGGEWKIAMDKLIENMKGSMGGSTTTAPTGPSNTNKSGDDDESNDNH